MTITNDKYAPRRLPSQVDEIADADIEFREALETLVNSVQFEAIGSISDEAIKGVPGNDIGLLIDIVSAKFLKMRRLVDYYWPCGCCVAYVNENCGVHGGPC